MIKELLTCPICNKQFQTLNSHIHFKHKLTTEELLEKYPNTKLVSELIKETLSQSCKKSGCGKWMKDYEWPKWRRKQYRQVNSGKGNPFFGKKHTKKTRKQMSDNHADFRGNKNPLVKWLKDPKNKELYSQRMKEVWQDERLYKIACERNLENAKKMVLNGNHHPYSNCETGWFQSIKFNDRFYYQSSYEKRFLEFCELSDKIKALQKLPFVISYKDENGRKRNYYADFLVNQKIVIEIKPKSMLNYNHNKEKIKAGKKYCQNNGYEYKLLMEEELKDLNKML